jgi:hypothetical protein
MSDKRFEVNQEKKRMSTQTIAPETPQNHDHEDYYHDGECYVYHLELITGTLNFCYSMRSRLDTGLFETWIEKEAEGRITRFDIQMHETRKEAQEFALRQIDAYAIYYEALWLTN